MPTALHRGPVKAPDAPVGSSDVGPVKEAAQAMFDHVINVLARARADGGTKFFPNGVEVIDFSVSVKGLVELKLKIAGPNPKQAAGVTQTVPS